MPLSTLAQWTLVSAPLSVNLALNVDGEVAWPRATGRSRVAVDPCSGEQTVIYRSSTATLAKKRTRIPFVLPASTRAATITAVEAAIEKHGPYTLTTPWETLTVMLEDDPELVHHPYHSVYTIGVAEV